MFDATVSWHKIVKTFSKRERYSLGERIQNELLDAMIETEYARFSAGMEKVKYISLALRHMNAAILLVRLSNEIGVLFDEPYFKFSEKLFSIGRMLGGWKNDVLTLKK